MRTCCHGNQYLSYKGKQEASCSTVGMQITGSETNPHTEMTLMMTQQAGIDNLNSAHTHTRNTIARAYHAHVHKHTHTHTHTQTQPLRSYSCGINTHTHIQRHSPSSHTHTHKQTNTSTHTHEWECIAVASMAASMLNGNALLWLAC